MLIDLHAHTSGVSSCCSVDFEEVINTAKLIGLDGLVITNHYIHCYIENPDYKYGFITPKDFADFFIDEYEKTKAYADSIGFKTYFGIELTPDYDTRVHLLIYGVDTNFVRENYDLYKYSLKDLYALVKKYGGTLIQAHPFRNGATVQDVKYLDGLEINCHPKYQNSYADTLPSIALENKLSLICGADFHNDTYRPICGTYFPDSVKNINDIKDFILTTKEVTLRIHEVNAPTFYEKTYKLNR